MWLHAIINVMKLDRPHHRELRYGGDIKCILGQMAPETLENIFLISHHLELKGFVAVEVVSAFDFKFRSIPMVCGDRKRLISRLRPPSSLEVGSLGVGEG